MGAYDFASSLVRLIILIGGLAALPIVYRSGARWYTHAATACGLLLVAVSEGLLLLPPSLKEPLGPLLAVLAGLRMDEAGYAIILLGFLFGLHDLRRTGDRLHRRNLTLAAQASTDFLTGLLNRRQAELLMEYGVARARRSGEPLGFVMIDLDDFKKVNDAYGHAAGDAVLAHVAAILKSRVRASDIVARYGGDEFLVVTPDASDEDVLVLADRLRILIEQNPAKHGSVELPASASLGVFTSNGDAEDAVRDAIGKADAALYAAKASGGNRVVSWREIVPRDSRPCAGAAADGTSQGAACKQRPAPFGVLAGGVSASSDLRR